MCLTCASDADYRHDKKCDAYTADDDCWASSNHKSSRWAARLDESDGEDQHQGLMDDAWDAHLVEDSTSTWSARLLGSLSLSTSRASGFQSLSQPEQRRSSKKLQGQLQRQLSADYTRP